MVSSPEAECGKSTLLGLIKLITPRGHVFVQISPPALYRMLEKWHPTIIVDEADTVFKGNAELRAVVNSGWTRGAGVPRCNPDTHEPEFFETFGPKVIGLKGLNVPGTTLGRSIIIDMERKLPGDKVDDFDHTDDEELAQIRQQLSRFALDNMDALRGATPQFPDGFVNRLRANWRLMLAVAERCGSGKEARKAAEVLSRRTDEASLGVELLRDIRVIFSTGIGLERLQSEMLVHRLVSLPDRPWSEMPFPYSGKPITTAQVAKLLKPFKVKPTVKRFGAETFRGYSAEDFDRAYRYIPTNQEDDA
jgi:putative DNA primase/helicase